MEGNCDTVPSLTFVVEHIYSSCDPEGNDAVSVSTLIDFLRPLMSNYPLSIAELQQTLDPIGDDPVIGKTSFYEAMQKWTKEIDVNDSKLSSFSIRESDSFGETELPFHQSTPKPSMSPSAVKHVSNILNIQNISPTSFTNNSRNSTTEKVKELEHKYANALEELKMVKLQLASSEEQYAELKLDLDRTNKRLISEQQVNADLQKNLEHQDDFKEKEVINTKKEIEHLQKMWCLAKKENSNLIASIKDLEFEKEKLDKRNNEIIKRENQKKKEVLDLQMILSQTEEENKSLKNSKNELEKKLDEQNELLKHFSELSEELKNENKLFKVVIKKSGIVDLNDLANMRESPDFSVPGTPINTPKIPFLKAVLTSSTPFKNMYQPSEFNREVFENPKFVKKIVSSLIEEEFDTPTNSNCIYRPTEKLGRQVLDYSHTVEKQVGVIHNPKGLGLEKVACSENPQNKASNCNIEDPKKSSPSTGNETVEDLDLTEDLENQLSKGQDLLSELQECQFLDNRDKCFVQDHADLFKTVKEHENCTKIIVEYQQKMQRLVKEINSLETDNNNLLANYKCMKTDFKYLENLLSETETHNNKLMIEKTNLEKTVSTLNHSIEDKEKELVELQSEKTDLEKIVLTLNHSVEDKEKELVELRNIKTELEEISEMKDVKCTELNELEKKYELLMIEKRGTETEMMEKECKNKKLLDENSNLKKTINERENELNELKNMRMENRDLLEEISNIKLEQEKNCNDVEKLMKKLEECNIMGKQFVDTIKKKIMNQNTKVEFLNNYNEKLKETVEELQNELENTKTKLAELRITIENSSVRKGKVDKEPTTSRDSSETDFLYTRPEFRKRSSYIKRLSYERQQSKVEKLEEEIETLKEELSTEKTKAQKVCTLEFHINNLELEKLNFMEERNSIIRELESIKYNISLKDQMMQQFEEKHKFQIENLSNTFEKERELINLQLRTTQKEAEENKSILERRIEELETNLNHCMVEKKNLETILKKQEADIIKLKNALSDLTDSNEKAKVFEDAVNERESMLKFNRELLAKSNSTLKYAEDRMLSLELLLDKCKMVLFETTRDIFRNTKHAFDAWKWSLKSNEIKKCFDELENLGDADDVSLDELTEQEIWKINNRLILAGKLLKTLAEKAGDFKPRDVKVTKSISKFTLRPSKLRLYRLPSSDPDITSSGTKDTDSQNSSDPRIGTATDKEVMCTSVENVPPLKDNDSVTDWLGDRVHNLSVQMISESPKNLCDVSSETESYEKSDQSTNMEDPPSVVPDVKEIVLRKPPKLHPLRTFYKRCSTFLMTIFSMFVLLLTLCVYLHLECLRRGNGSVVCPLDFLITVKRAFPPH